MTRRRRPYDRTRGAHYPRAWPTLLTAAPAALVTTWRLPLDQLPLALNAVGAALVGATVGLGAVWLRWWAWKRRHPVIPVHERARQSALWN